MIICSLPESLYVISTVSSPKADMTFEGLDALIRAKIDRINNLHNRQRKQILSEANKELPLMAKLSRKGKNNFNSSNLFTGASKMVDL